MKTTNDLLNYKNLKIVQDDDFFRFSLDSVLLPNFATITKKTKKILDLGTGNAPIPMILSTRVNDDTELYGIELQEKIFSLAIESLQINNLSKRIKLINDDMKNLHNYFNINSFDLILSNPPYFKLFENSTTNDIIEKTIARHEKAITLNQIIEIAKLYLKNGGTFAMVHRTDRMIEILELLKKNKLEPKKLQLIYPKENSESNLMLIEARKNGNPGLKVLAPIITHYNNGEYTKQIKKYFE
mgnify:FL=1